MSTSLRQPGREILSICGAGVSSHVNSGIAAPSLSTILRLKAAMRAMFSPCCARGVTCRAEGRDRRHGLRSGAVGRPLLRAAHYIRPQAKPAL